MEKNGNVTKKDLHELENRVDARLKHMDGRLDSMGARLDSMDGRLDSMDGRLNDMDGRLNDMDGRLRGIDGRLDSMETRIVDRLTELVRDVETNLLTSFHGYGKGQSARMHTLEVSDSATSQRLAALEDRVLNLETRRGPGAH